MANTYKNIVITPNIGSNSDDPKVVFSGGNTTTNTDITLRVYPLSNGTLSFEGSAGQLFSITNDLANNLFSISDISGIPSLEVYANGLVSIAPLSGNVAIGNSANFIIAQNAVINSTAYYWVGNTTTSPTITLANTGSFTIGNSTTTQTGSTIAIANSVGNVQIVPATLTVQNSTVNAVVGLQSLVIQSNTTVNGSITNALVQVANSTSNVQVTATTVKAQTNTTVNSTISSSLVQVSNSTSTANLSAIDLKIDTTTVNSSALALGTAFTANSTVVNAVSYYSGTLLVANSTVSNATHLGGTAASGYQTTAGLSANVATLTSNNTTFINGNNVLTVMQSLRANRALHGGGTITVSASGDILWSARFIVISNGRGTHFSTEGFFNISCPTSGTITGVGGAANKTATAAGIPLGAWEALYYILPIGSNSGSLAANFRVVNYTSDVEIPSTWLLICAQNGDNSNYYFNNGIILKASQSFVGGTFTSANMPQANNANNLGGVAAASYVQNTDSRILSGNLNFTGTNNFFSSVLFVGSNNFINTTAIDIGNTVISTTNAVFGGTIAANGGIGSAGQALISGAGANAYWATIGNGTVTSVGSGNGLTGGAITTTGSLSVLANNGITANSTGTFVTQGSGVAVNSTGVHVLANTGIVANTTGTFVNATYIGTISANNASFLGGVAAASYVQNTDSRTLSGNLTFTGITTLSANIVLGTTTITANGGVGTAGQVLTSGATGNVYWASAAGGGYYKGGTAAVGTLAAGGQNIFRVNANVLNTSTTLVAGENAQATGPITVASGVTLTVESGARVSIV